MSNDSNGKPTVLTPEDLKKLRGGKKSSRPRPKPVKPKEGLDAKPEGGGGPHGEGLD